MIFPDQYCSQGDAVSLLLKQAREDNMTHALLITGEAGMGKWTLARGIASALLCQHEDPARRPCGNCLSCIQMENLTHPDLIVIQKGEPLVPTDTKNNIPVSDINEMIRRVSLQGYEGNRHVVIIRHAEDMRPDAQNKLLKTLEEPPEGTFFLLTCPETDLLLPTIVSRCRPLRLHRRGTEEILRILEENGFEDRDRMIVAAEESEGAIGQALHMMEDDTFWAFREQVRKDFLACVRRSDVIQISARWKERKDDTPRLFAMLGNLFSRMMRISLDSSGTSSDWIRELPEKWQSFIRRANGKDYIQLFDALSLASQRTKNQVNLQTVIEQLLFSLMEAVDL